MDPGWSFESKVYTEKRKDTIREIEGILSKYSAMELGLEGPRRKLVASEKPLEKRIVVKLSERSNWYKL